MSFQATSKSWLVTVPIALASAAYVWFIFLPGKRAIADLHTELQNNQIVAASAGKTTAAINQVTKLAGDTQAYIEEHRLPAGSSAQMARIFADIAEAARRAGVRTTRFAPEPLTAYDSLQKSSLRLGCVGRFAEVGSLLESLERMPQRIWIDSMSLQSDGENGEAVRCEAVLAVFVDKPEISN